MNKYPGIFLTLLLAVVCYQRNAVWKNDGTLWMDSAVKSPAKARGYNEIGLHYVNARDYDKALGAFTRSLALDAYQPQVYMNIGLAYEGQGRMELAMQSYEKAIAISPGDPIPYYNLGIIYYQYKKDLPKALELFTKARDLNPLEPDVHQYIGNIHRDSGKQDLAEEEFRLFRELK